MINYLVLGTGILLANTVLNVLMASRGAVGPLEGLVVVGLNALAVSLAARRFGLTSPTGIALVCAASVAVSLVLSWLALGAETPETRFASLSLGVEFGMYVVYLVLMFTATWGISRALG